MEKHDHTFHFREKFQLESGEVLPGFQLRYTTLGRINADRSNVVWVCHALTGSSDISDWWRPLFAPGSPLDPAHHLVICANVPGGCYGSTGPLSINPENGNYYFHDFPLLTNRDAVCAFDLLRQHLGIGKIHTLIGGSLGGQQVLEWAIQQPDVFERIIPIACNAYHSPWGIAFNETQRLAIAADPTWTNDEHRAGEKGMLAARAIAMLSYRHYDGYRNRQSELSADKLDDFRAASYQRYQGEKLVKRFNAFTYWTLSKMMDNHHVGRGRESVEAALRSIKARALVIGIDSDILFPVQEQEYLARYIPDAEFRVINSLFGHDGFLVEFDQLNHHLQEFLNERNSIRKAI